MEEDTTYAGMDVRNRTIAWYCLTIIGVGWMFPRKNGHGVRRHLVSLDFPRNSGHLEG